MHLTILGQAIAPGIQCLLQLMVTLSECCPLNGHKLFLKGGTLLLAPNSCNQGVTALLQGCHNLVTTVASNKVALCMVPYEKDKVAASLYGCGKVAARL